MSTFLKTEQLWQLKMFVDLCMTNPALLHEPKFAFVKTFIEHFGGTIPKGEADESPSKKSKNADMNKASEPEAETELDSEEESDLELDMSGVIEPDTDAPQQMGDLTLEPTEEDIAESQVKRSNAVSAFAEKDYEKAIELYTEAIVLNPHASLFYAKRGQVYLLLNRPNACIRDCNRVLELNPDSAAAHKFRGRAYYLLGKFEESVADLRLACKFDFDEEVDKWLHEVTPNARKIEEHKRKKERNAKENIECKKQEKQKKTQQSTKTSEENTTTPPQTGNTDESIDTGGHFLKFINNMKSCGSLKDPDLFEALQDISANPMNILKYQSNPKVMEFMIKMASNIGTFPPNLDGNAPNTSTTEGPTEPTAKTPPPQEQGDELD